MVINYIPLNESTIKFRYPTPHKDTILTHLMGIIVYSKFNCKSGFYQTKTKPEDIHKTTFIAAQVQYDNLVMPCGLNNALTYF